MKFVTMGSVPQQCKQTLKWRTALRKAKFGPHCPVMTARVVGALMIVDMNNQAKLNSNPINPLVSLIIASSCSNQRTTPLESLEARDKKCSTPNFIPSTSHCLAGHLCPRPRHRCPRNKMEQTVYDHPPSFPEDSLGEQT